MILMTLIKWLAICACCFMLCNVAIDSMREATKAEQIKAMSELKYAGCKPMVKRRK